MYCYRRSSNWKSIDRLMKSMLFNAKRSWISPTQNQLISWSFKSFLETIKILIYRKGPKILIKRKLPQPHEIIRSYDKLKILPYLFRRQELVDKFYQSPFRSMNRKLFNGTCFSIGFATITLSISDRDRFNSIKEKPFDYRNYFQTKTSLFEKDDYDYDEIKNAACLEFTNFISKGCCGAVHRAKIKSKTSIKDVAVKILFNYEAGSDSYEIYKHNLKECLPFKGDFGEIEIKRKTLPDHPNIVKILSVFVDEFLPVGDELLRFPINFPRRLGGDCYNRTLFVIQKLYCMTLEEYLKKSVEKSTQKSLAILVQCFEALDFLNRNQIAHRDIKPDNILVKFDDIEAEDFPWIVLSDFGLCSTSLRIPHETDEICLGGNKALMAPEIKTNQPSKHSVLDYNKADMWSMATIAFEIFGQNNPFYRKNSDYPTLNGATYREDQLPQFQTDIVSLSSLIRLILQRDPRKRPSIHFVTDYCHLLLQKGYKQVEKLIRMNGKFYDLRNDLILDWFKSILYDEIVALVHENRSIPANNFNRMRLMFLARIDSKRLISVLDDAAEIL
ncbi:Serine/threonine-protein kinase PINK1 [Sarcoptes scabiei]|uniref:non-specific serine/threonine protein kinase n=1 Tax=Sarcoptes scabiei TaxID=52283 RepID=A0A834RB37_SARSC|nr:Serine/threonine-protein kinase PINK1 [Sarcoptes scabiei]